MVDNVGDPVVSGQRNTVKSRIFSYLPCIIPGADPI